MFAAFDLNLDTLLTVDIYLLNYGVDLWFDMLGNRFRDIPQIVTAVLQFVFFLTPIFWIPAAGLQNSPAVIMNPFYFSIQMIREPLLHGTMPMEYLRIMGLAALAGWVATLLLYNQSRRRVVHYL